MYRCTSTCTWQFDYKITTSKKVLIHLNKSNFYQQCKHALLVQVLHAVYTGTVFLTWRSFEHTIWTCYQRNIYIYKYSSMMYGTKYIHQNIIQLWFFLFFLFFCLFSVFLFLCFYLSNNCMFGLFFYFLYTL